MGDHEEDADFNADKKKSNESVDNKQEWLRSNNQMSSLNNKEDMPFWTDRIRIYKRKRMLNVLID